MKANKFHIDNEHLYNVIAFVNGDVTETISSFDLKTPRKDLLAAIDECVSMLVDLELANQAFSKLAKKVPKKLKYDGGMNIKTSVCSKVSIFSSRVYEFAEVYADVVDFASNIIKELSGIVFEEENLPWEAVNSEHKKELIEMANIRLMACTRLLAFCNDLKPKIHPLLIEAKNIFTESNNQSDLILKSFRGLGYKLSENSRQIKPVLDKLTHYIVVDLTKTEDGYGRYEFNKWLHSWRRNIIDWKLRAYRGVDRKDIVIVSLNNIHKFR